MQVQASHVTQELEILPSHKADPVADIIGQHMSVVSGVPLPQREFIPPATKEQHEMLAEEKKKEAYLGRIAQIETGGLTDKFIRTKAAGSGSSAYGPYQVTMGLTEEYLEKHADIFSPEELRALKEIRDRQKTSLAIGGSDRKAYERGGVKAFEGQRLALMYGFSDVDEFLTAFDYGGDFGYKGDKDALQSAQEKMALRHYEENEGNELQAAAEWHGGKGWKTSPHLPQTQDYLRKYQYLQGNT
jgi:hypothetical protein